MFQTIRSRKQICAEFTHNRMTHEIFTKQEINQTEEIREAIVSFLNASFLDLLDSQRLTKKLYQSPIPNKNRAAHIWTKLILI